MVSSRTSRPMSAFLALVIAVFFSLVAVGGATAGENSGGKGKGGEQSQEAKPDGDKSSARSSGGTSSQKAQKTPDQTLNDHPSGKDRTGTSGGSGTQGKSTSDPDGMSNGGADKPGGDGGFDADKDGNNGCGNDDDFEDDNNGWCGKPSDVDRDIEEEIEVLGVTFDRSGGGTTAVLGQTFTRTAPGTLAATGANSAVLAGLGVALVMAGVLMVLASARRVQPIRLTTK